MIALWAHGHLEGRIWMRAVGRSPCEMGRLKWKKVPSTAALVRLPMPPGEGAQPGVEVSGRYPGEAVEEPWQKSAVHESWTVRSRVTPLNVLKPELPTAA